MAALSIQALTSVTGGGLQYTYASAASGGDTFANDGRTFLLVKNANASTRTVTADAVASLDKPGFGTVPISDSVLTVPGSGTNGGLTMWGPFPPERFNNSSGAVALTYSDSAADLTIAAVRMPQYA